MLSRCGAAGCGGVAATDTDVCFVIWNIPHDGCWIHDAKWIGLFRGSHNACWMTRSVPSGAEVCTFLFWMVHCGMPDGCAVGWVRMVYCNQCLTDLSKLLCGTYDIDICLILLVCIRYHVMYVSCDCIMKCIFVWTQVVNKLLLLLLLECPKWIEYTKMFVSLLGYLISALWRHMATKNLINIGSGNGLLSEVSDQRNKIETCFLKIAPKSPEDRCVNSSPLVPHIYVSESSRHWFR